MKVFQDVKDANAKSKSLKPLVERRRRERMNRSLDALKSVLLQRQEESPRRVEKAEILEHTVLFLQNSAKRDKTRAGAGGEGHKHSFQDGFSTCLHRAAQFLGPDGKDVGLGAALEASFAARLASSHSESTKACSSSSSSLPTKSPRAVLRMLIQKSGYRGCTAALNVVGCVRTCGATNRSLTTSHQPHNGASRANKQSPAQSHQVIQCLWRPWF
ncbi:Transcription factor HES-7.1-A HES-related protein 1-A [Channa argus]|uniref:Transcription factor HES-7.1-A HES-related protein 1-A n=1 Tax=Channa argus TaxID=215402 RepID=A0A6G1PQ14_CHAAH|nr:Transcription factor HES-7.1-A HES-related protein 1-A [Channa argus]